MLDGEYWAFTSSLRENGIHHRVPCPGAQQWYCRKETQAYCWKWSSLVGECFHEGFGMKLSELWFTWWTGYLLLYWMAQLLLKYCSKYRPNTTLLGCLVVLASQILEILTNTSYNLDLLNVLSLATAWIIKVTSAWILMGKLSYLEMWSLVKPLLLLLKRLLLLSNHLSQIFRPIHLHQSTFLPLLLGYRSSELC